MNNPDDFDGMFGDIWGDESFRKLFQPQKNLERTLREYVKKLIESVKRGELQGKSELIPIEKPGIKGFIFRQEFGTLGTPDGESKAPVITGETSEGKHGFTLPGITKEDEREPVVETFANGDDFVALVELPGVEERDIKVEMGNGWIEIEALNFKPMRIYLPPDSDIGKMAKTYKNGVLEIKVPIQPNFRKDDDVRIGVA